MSARHPNLLALDSAVLVVVDLQEAFRPVIHEFEQITSRTSIVLRAAALLNLPVLVTEQSPQKLGPTVAEIRDLLPAVHASAVDKTAFSSCGASVFSDQLKRLRRRQVLLCGIEAHVCVNQTAHDLLSDGYQVHVLADCISSRTPQNREIGLAKMTASGALPGSSEMALFELLRDAKHEQFRAISKLIR
jgi:nicotinamidase-related amidase